MEWVPFVGHGAVEQAFGTFQNLSGSTITKGLGGHLLTTANSNTGYAVTNVTTEEVRLFVGIAEADIADTKLGRFTTYGYAASVNYFAMGSSITINPGDPLGPHLTGASLGIFSGGLKTAFGPVLNMSAAAITVSAGGYLSGWVRAL